MPESIFLTKEELTHLIGTNQAVKQRQWLAERGYMFDVRLDGSNVVLRYHLLKKLGGQDRSSKGRPVEPDKAALKSMTRHA